MVLESLEWLLDLCRQVMPEGDDAHLEDEISLATLQATSSSGSVVSSVSIPVQCLLYVHVVLLICWHLLLQYWLRCS